jgi:hypothetical protein
VARELVAAYSEEHTASLLWGGWFSAWPIFRRRHNIGGSKTVEQKHHRRWCY